SAAEQARVATILEHILPIAPRRAGLLNDATVISSLERFDLERIAVPTLAISTADCLYGTLEGARYTAEHVAGARFIGYPTGGHLCVGHQGEIAPAIAAFAMAAIEGAEERYRSPGTTLPGPNRGRAKKGDS